MQSTESLETSGNIRDADPQKDTMASASHIAKLTVLDTNFKYKCSSYTDTDAICSVCLLLTPHSQLFVCLKTSCGYCLKQTDPILSPSAFYRQETVFCGPCAFRGLHSPHKKYMKSAKALAFKTASGEVGGKLEIELDEFVILRDDNPMDYVLIQKTGKEALPKIPVTDFLATSETVAEWRSRLSIVQNTLSTIRENRLQSYLLVREQAEKMLTAYSTIAHMIKDDIASEMLESERQEHLLQMGIDDEEGTNDNTIIASDLSVSSRSSTNSDSTTSTVLTVIQKSAE